MLNSIKLSYNFIRIAINEDKDYYTKIGLLDIYNWCATSYHAKQVLVTFPQAIGKRNLAHSITLINTIKAQHGIGLQLWLCFLRPKASSIKTSLVPKGTNKASNLFFTIVLCLKALRANEYKKVDCGVVAQTLGSNCIGMMFFEMQKNILRLLLGSQGKNGCRLALGEAKP